MDLFSELKENILPEEQLHDSVHGFQSPPLLLEASPFYVYSPSVVEFFLLWTVGASVTTVEPAKRKRSPQC